MILPRDDSMFRGDPLNPDLWVKEHEMIVNDLLTPIQRDSNKTLLTINNYPVGTLEELPLWAQSYIQYLWDQNEITQAKE